MRSIRVANTSRSCIKTEVCMTAKNTSLIPICALVILPHKSKYLCIQQKVEALAGCMIRVSYLHKSGRWIEIESIRLELLNIDILCIDENDGIPVLRELGCTSNGVTSGEMYYYDFHNKVTPIMRLYAEYYIDGKLYSKKTSGRAVGQSTKLWLPVEAKNIWINYQSWFFGWDTEDSEFLEKAEGNYYCEAYYKSDIDKIIYAYIKKL